MKDIPAIII